METNANPQNALRLTGKILSDEMYSVKQKIYQDGSTGKVCGYLVEVDGLGQVIANYTLLNSKGVEKAPLKKDDVISVYITEVVRHDGNGTILFKEIGGLFTDSTEIDNKLRAMMQEKAQAEFKEQGI